MATGSPTTPVPNRQTRETTAGTDVDTSPRRSPRLMAAQGHQQGADEVLPWLGQTQKLDKVGKLIVSQYEHTIVYEQKLDEKGEVVQQPKIRYKTVYEPDSKTRWMGERGFNASRLGEYLFLSPHTPHDIKFKVASQMRSGKAKDFVRECEKRKAAAEEYVKSGVDMSGPASSQVAKVARTDSNRKERLRQTALDKFVATDSPMPEEWFNLALYYLAITFYMCRLSFHVVTNLHFLRFLWAVRPNFAKKIVPRTLERALAVEYLDEAYEEAKEITKTALSNFPGRLTLGMDGHRESKSRQVETITISKLGISTFAHAEYLRTERATGKRLASLACKYLSTEFVALVADNTSNNTGSESGLFAKVLEKHPTLFCIGCYVHVLDLLLEDIAKLRQVKAIGDDAHFCVSFVKRHPLLAEQFFICQEMLGIATELVLFPTTRFAYMHLMIKRVMTNASALRLLSESAIYQVVKAATKKRSDAARAMEDFKRFELLVDTRSFKERLNGGVDLLEPPSLALHYSEGDAVPLSHIYPLFQHIFDFSQTLDEYETIMTLLPDEEDRDAAMSCVRNRWLGCGRKVGLMHDVHMLAFLLDPFVQAAYCSPDRPECDLITGDVMEASRRALRHLASDDHAKRSVLLQQLMLWNSSYPELRQDPAGDDTPDGSMAAQVAVPMGNNAFSSARLEAMRQIWDVAAKAQRQEAGSSNAAAEEQRDSSSESAERMQTHIAKLKRICSPTQYWLSQMREFPRGATADVKGAHMLFCKVALDVSSIVGHTCGTERAGKAYKLVVSPLRTRLKPDRATKAIFVFSNYNTSLLKQVGGYSYTEFDRTFGGEPSGRDEDIERNTLRRGTLIVDEVCSENDSNSDRESVSDSDNSDEETTRIAWSLPDGFRLGEEPRNLDGELVGCFICFNWREYGWQVGKLTAMVTSAQPRLFKKFNYRVAWLDGTKGLVMLKSESYSSGPHAAPESWVRLELA